jgi:hypothetical protein
LIHAAPLVASAIVEAATKLYGDEPERSHLIARARAAGITDAMPQVLDSIAALASVAPP